MESSMNANVGKIDKVVRLVLALVLFSLFFILQSDAKWLGLLGLVPLATGLVSWCPLYTLFGMNTCKR
jgi:cadmium resistance protein CadD (predicted permease)